MQPTDEQIKKFWEWCGFKWLKRSNLLVEEDWDIKYPGQPITHYHSPDLTLNNLFKYAVPKIVDNVDNDSIEISFLCPIEQCDFWVVHIKNRQITLGRARGDTEALALFWAIWEAR